MVGIFIINLNIISKVYGEFERDGIIEILRGKGIFVVDNFKSKVDENKMQYILEELKKIILEVSYNGMNKDLFVELVFKIFFELGVDNK